MKTPTHPWGLSDGLEFVSKLQPLAREVGYHVLLGGGVLNRGMSEKDLDVFCVPLNGEESKPNEMLGKIQSITQSWGDPIRDSPDYKAGEPWHWQVMVKMIYMRKRIDIFIQ